jgi:uncharacterized protein (DUF1501 family)
MQLKAALHPAPKMLDFTALAPAYGSPSKFDCTCTCPRYDRDSFETTPTRGGSRMFHNDEKAANGDALSRRQFLRAGTLGAGSAALTLADLNVLGAAASAKDINCILLFLVGGPSHIDTFDPKPDAPANVRGPFKTIRTNVPGIHLGEHLPRMASVADKFAIVRSVHHTAAPIHESGHQLMQTGRLFRNGQEYPHYGSVLGYVKGARKAGHAPFALLPGPIESTGVSVSHGQTAGYLGSRYEPVVDSPSHRFGDRYGDNTFARSCLLARRLIESGTRFVTVNMFDTVFNNISWDCHADGGSLATTLADYAETLCPIFDRAYTALLEDLEQRGLLETTLVLAVGEFGRTPQINPRGGRDHWTGCWSVLFAGAGIRGGQVVGSSDRLGGEPKDRPVQPADIAATVYKALGLDPATKVPGPSGDPIALAEGRPILELF